MWNESGVQYGQAGGFMNNSADFDSPSDQNKKTVRRAQNIIPSTVKQLLNSPDEVFRIGDIEVHLVTIIGIVKSIDVTSTKVTYTVTDDTGTINAILWLDGPMPDNGVVENAYCRLYGSLRTHQGTRNIMIFKILPLENLNEFTSHLLEVVEFGLNVEQKISTQSVPAMSKPGSHTLSNSLMNVRMNEQNFSMGNVPSGLNQKQLWVLDIVKRTTDAVGISKGMISTQLAGKVSIKEITEIVEFLSSEGHIYSTIDDDHYAFTS